ncbi:Hypothetical_protein [Hexamita inflata]|uniref:Hypothetical_protein n=1 Tax=Hexamita inflata TaxID=28002 RepID=A0AA86V238_9EUKA|nr:Hypothetical protein HINF_LOCUS60794 [Hexamita inflata]CAI9973150.1 Hypothetical protein HINF_LOCUS60795 [Hexamita inflata]CAI9973151.1 Hypothetical protein HINF_LOCUS60796 [Hexamita inflata]CAI9973152.1 Hypothetical protein HINF_LOCUS60797 [Hexamita inflata]
MFCRQSCVVTVNAHLQNLALVLTPSSFQYSRPTELSLNCYSFRKLQAEANYANFRCTTQAKQPPSQVQTFRPVVWLHCASRYVHLLISMIYLIATQTAYSFKQ